MFIQLTKDFLGRKPGERIDVSEADAHHLMGQGVADVVKDDPLAPLLTRSAETLLANLTSSLNASIDSALKEFAQTQTRSRRNAVPLLFGEGSSGDPKRTFGQFLLAVRNRDHHTLEKLGSRFCEWEATGQKAALSTQTGAQGGFTVPTEFYNRL